MFSALFEICFQSASYNSRIWETLILSTEANSSPPFFVEVQLKCQGSDNSQQPTATDLPLLISPLQAKWGGGSIHLVFWEKNGSNFFLKIWLSQANIRNTPIVSLSAVNQPAGAVVGMSPGAVVTMARAIVILSVVLSLTMNFLMSK